MPIVKLLPSEDQQETKEQQDGVRARATREHEVQVHEGAADRGDPHERAKDQRDADLGLAEGDEF